MHNFSVRYPGFWIPLLLVLIAAGLATTSAKMGQTAAREATLAAGKSISSYQRPGRQFTHWDGYRYEEIIDLGYIYDNSEDSRKLDTRTGEMRLKNVVWYPLYPVLGWLVKQVTGLPTHHALTLVSQMCAAGAGLAFFALLRRHYRRTMGTPGWVNAAATCGLLLLFMGPCAIFLYANFTESLFLFLLTLFLLFVDKKQWWAAALVAAISSSCRSQGVLFGMILTLTFLLQAREYRIGWRCLGTVLIGMISLTGLASYMFYLWKTFGDPLAFMKAQKNWDVGLNAHTFSYALNPINAVTNAVWYVWYRPSVLPMDWPHAVEALSVVLPPLILLAGWRRLNLTQTLVGWMMWGLPYVSNSLAASLPYIHPHWMSMGRFMAVVLPLQIIVSDWLVGASIPGVPGYKASFRRLLWGENAADPLVPISLHSPTHPELWRLIVALTIIGISIGLFVTLAYCYGHGDWVG